MKKTSLILSIALALAACQQEELVQQEVIASPEDFVASVEDYSGATKTSLNEKNQILWSEDDQISIFNGSFTNKLYQVKSLTADKRNATFSLSPDSIVDNDPVEMDGNLAFYPYMNDMTVSYMYDEGNDQPTGLRIEGISIPRDQIYAESSFCEESFPMVAITRNASDHQLKFKNLLGVLKLDICGDKTVKSISVTGNTGEALWGTFSADVPYGNEAPSLNIVAGRMSGKVLDCGEGVQLNPIVPTSFYITMPPTRFEEGFVVQINDSEGNMYTRITRESLSIERSAILAMPQILIGGAIDIEEEIAEIPTDGTPVEITLNSTLDWTASYIPEWVTVTPSYGTAGTTKVSISMTGDYPVYDSNYTYLEFLSVDNKDRITIVKDIPVTDCGDVLAGTENCEYRIKGLVTEVVNTLYGNFYVEDETGQIYIYGTTNKGYLKQFSEQNIGVGDIVTIQGAKVTYGSNIEFVNAAVVDVQKSLIRIIGMDLESTELPITGTDFTLHLRCTGEDFTVNIPESEQSWVTWTGTEKVNDSEYAVHFTADANTGGNRTVKILFEYYSDGQRYIDHITLLQAGHIIECTLQEFVNAPIDVNVMYKLTGVITEIINTTYGNFYISDGTTEAPIFVYGMTTKGEISKNDKSFASIGLAVGDTVTLVGVRGGSNSTVQVGSGSNYQSYYVSHTSPQN